jgi:outer membrane protein assembly factor BamB
MRKEKIKKGVVVFLISFFYLFIGLLFSQGVHFGIISPIEQLLSSKDTQPGIVSAIKTEIESALGFRKKWALNVDGVMVFPPAIGSDGTIYLSCSEFTEKEFLVGGKLYAINPNGIKKWELNGLFLYLAVGADETIYAVSPGRLYAINPNGTKKWEFLVSDHWVSPPAIGSDGTIYYNSDKLYAINPDGTKKWELVIGTGVFYSPQYNYAISYPTIWARGTIYRNSKRTLFLTSSEVSKFATNISFEPIAHPTIGSDGTIYVGGEGNKFYAINSDGTKKWELMMETYPLFSVIGSDGTIYVYTMQTGAGSPHNPTRGGELHAISPNGREKWRFYMGLDFRWVPVIGPDGTIYAIIWSDMKLCALNTNDGTTKWEFKLPFREGFGTSAVIGSDGTIYLPCFQVTEEEGVLIGGKLYAINPDGTKKWEFSAESFPFLFSSMVLDFNGTLYLGLVRLPISFNTTLYAIEVSAGLAKGLWPAWRQNPKNTGRKE